MIEITKITDIKEYLDGTSVIIFDLDDTLYSEKEYVRSGYNAVAAGMCDIENMSEKLWRVFECGGLPIDEVLLSEDELSEKNKKKCIEIYRAHIPNIHLYDGVTELLVCLRERGFKTGLITDGRPEGQRAKIKALDIEKYFDKIIITDELGGIQFRKPNKKAFMIMKEYFNVEFEQMVYIGDNINKDFLAPKQLGMKTIYFVNTDGIYN